MKIFTKIFILTFLFLTQRITAQEDINNILELTLSCRGLARQDITIPVDTSDRVNTNQCKLILPIVYNIMRDPLSSMPFLDSVMSYRNLELTELVYAMFRDNNYYNSSAVSRIENESKANFTTDLPALVKIIAVRIKKSHENEDKLLNSFTKGERDYLQKNLLFLFTNSDQNAPENFDIFKLNASEDSSAVITKKLLDILSKADREMIFENSVSDFLFYYRLYKFLDENKNNLRNRMDGEANIPGVKGDALYYYDADGIEIVIGGKGKNTYAGRFDLIADIGGDDAYYIERDSTFKNNFNCIIDLSGNDYYSSGSRNSLGASVFSSGFIFDKQGDDVYKAGDMNLGAAVCGIGMIYDESGSDIYSGNSFSIGAGCFGAGIVADRTGNDIYIANTYSQGFAMTEGIGIIVDNHGNDTYTINPLTPDIGRSNDHFLSMCQGFGFGLRPYYAGGIGIIVDGEGNDNYMCDIFGQGGSYWYSLGTIVDSSGNDKYSNYHYGQGSGIHFSVGLLKDYEGWDYYSSNWVSQGCGHDYGFGFLWDVKGNDNYTCYGLSQGAGSANGIGLLLDESGRDGYLSKDNNTQGFGLQSRDYGSIGILLDASGTDFYSKPGYDSLITNSSYWGILNDYPPADIHPEIAAEQFKIEIDTNKIYSRDELYIFARTLEPRFSKWAEYGFRKMVEDSVNTAEYVFPKLGSDDIRDIVVIRNFIPYIGFTVGSLIIDKLQQYLDHKLSLNTDEMSFAIYLLGESRNLAGKDVLLRLTYDERTRIRSASVSALGKMKFPPSDAEFVQKVTDRLIELASENNPKKTYNKDIAFAFRNFKSEKDIPVLLNMLSNNYYGVRFVASDDLSQYGDEYYDHLTDDVLSSVSSDKIRFVAFLNSLGNLTDDKFKPVIDRILNLDICRDEAVNYNLIALLRAKRVSTKDSNFLSWLNGVLTGLESKAEQRVR